MILKIADRYHNIRPEAAKDDQTFKAEIIFRSSVMIQSRSVFISHLSQSNICSSGGKARGSQTDI